MTEERLSDILKQAYDAYPETVAVPNEVEFSIVGYRVKPDSTDLVYDDAWNLGISKFSSILKSFIKGAPKPDPQIMLTIGVPDDSEIKEARVRIMDLDDIRVFCMNNKIPTGATYETKHKIKNRGKSNDCTEYGVRINYSVEAPITDAEIKRRISEIVADRSVRRKNYRYAQRYSVVYSDKLGSEGKGRLRVDFTSVRQGLGNDFRNANLTTAEAVEKYEIEIELTDIRKEDLKEGTDCYDLVRDCLRRILVPVHGGVTIGQHTTRVQAMKDYVALCNKLWNLGQPRVPDLSAHTMETLSGFFVAPNISTMDREVHVKSRVMLPDETNKDKYYFFTDKADGQHAVLFVNATGQCFIIVKSPISDKQKKSYDVPPAIYQTDLTLQGYRNCILDGEYMRDSGGAGTVYYYMIFDILAAEIQGKAATDAVSSWTPLTDYTNSKFFSVRQQFFSKIKGNNATFYVRPKKFHKYDLSPENNTFKKFVNALTLTKLQDSNEIDKIQHQDEGLLYELDGFVFQPNNDVYPKPTGKHSTWSTTLKWKPKRFLTVDLRVSAPRKGASKTTAMDIGLIANTENAENPEYAIFQAEYVDQGRNIVSDYPLYAKIREVSRSDADEPIRNGDIVECRFSSKGKIHWEPVRVRYDKQTPNGRNAYYSTVELIFNPVTMESLQEPGGGLGANRAVNDISRFLSNGNINYHVARIDEPIKALDLGCGAAKSGTAWKNLRLARIGEPFRVTGVDKVGHDNFAPATLFMSRLADSTGAQVFREREYGFYYGNFTLPLHEINGVNSPELVTELQEPEQYNAIACVFAIHYAMSREDTFRTFLANVSRNLKLGGLFVGSYMNKPRVLELFAMASSAAGKKKGLSKKDNKVYAVEDKEQIWSITYDATQHQQTDIFGHEISVEIQNLYGEQANKEYLIDLKDVRLLAIMKEYGLEPLAGAHKPFSTKDVKGARARLVPTMTSEQDLWFGLQYNFAFKKVSSFVDYGVLFSDIGKAVQHKDTSSAVGKLKKPAATLRAASKAPAAAPLPTGKPIPRSKVADKKIKATPRK